MRSGEVTPTRAAPGDGGDRDHGRQVGRSRGWAPTGAANNQPFPGTAPPVTTSSHAKSNVEALGL